MYNIKVEDFIDIRGNKSSFELNDIVHIGKRLNNKKREYLFIDKYQGKHYPETPTNILKLFDEFVNEIKANLDKNDRVLVVGFAETATGLAEYLSYKFSMDSEYGDTIVHHMQTSRENYKDCAKLFTFDEEHSHAVNQFLYSSGKVPEYDRVLFVEDEITTGNTILNFIEKFKEINPNCKYSVASILNWQSKENIEIFDKKEINRIYLINGEIKSNRPSLENIVGVEAEDYISDIEQIDVDNVLNYSISNSRKGINPNKFKENLPIVLGNVMGSISKYIKKNTSIMVVGTEEFMFYPLMVAKAIENQYDSCDVYYRATTRSPITPVNEEGYILKDSIKIPSAYEASRETYLYNMSGDYDQIIVVSDASITKEFKSAMETFADNNDKDIMFCEI